MLARKQTKPKLELTTAELVSALRSLARDSAMTSERLRHWARMGLLTPIGEANPGTGFHRRYSEGAVVRAAVLNALADMGYKITSVDKSLRDALDKAQGALRYWKSGDWAFLTVPLQRTPGALNAPWELGPAAFWHKPRGTPQPALSEMVHRGFLGVTVIDLGQVFEVIEGLPRS